MSYYRKLKNSPKILDYLVGLPFAIFICIVAFVWYILESIYKFIKIEILEELK